MNLWQRLEERGRLKLMLGHSWYLYAVDLDKPSRGWAEVKFARKDTQGVYKVEDTAFGNIEYFDLR